MTCKLNNQIEKYKEKLNILLDSSLKNDKINQKSIVLFCVFKKALSNPDTAKELINKFYNYNSSPDSTLTNDNTDGLNLNEHERKYIKFANYMNNNKTQSNT